MAGEEHEALVEVVVLHGGGGVESGQVVAALDLEAVVGSSVVKIMTETSYHQRQTLQLPQLLPPGGVGDDGEHELTHIESVSPIMIGNTSVVPAN